MAAVLDSSVLEMDGASMMSAAYSTVSSTSTKRKVKKKRPPSQAPSEPAKPAFSPDMVPGALSQLGKTADGLRPAYLRVDISCTDMSDCSALAPFKELQVVALPGNDLTDLCALSALPRLTQLEVPGNKLSQLLGFDPPAGTPSNLRSADFSSNRITHMTPISHFSRLASLNLNENQIEVITGLAGLSMLRVLNMAGNKLRSLRGLEPLTSIVELDVSRNSLLSLEPLSGLTRLGLLKASHNAITSLRGLERLTALRELDVSHNALPSLAALAPVSGAPLLGELSALGGNPAGRAHSARLHAVYLLPQVAVLDGEPVAAKEKVLAANMHGADADGLRAIRRKYFPNGELDDGGGAIPPPAAGLVASAAEEECADPGGMAAAFARVDGAVRGIAAPGLPPPTPASRGPGSRVPSRGATPSVGAAAAAGSYGSVSGVPQRAPSPVVGSTRGGAGDAGTGTGAGAGAGMDGDGAPPAAALLALAQEIARACAAVGDSQLLLARGCYTWVASHAVPPPGGCAGFTSVDAPLLSHGGAEAALLGDTPGGTWAERAALLFSRLVRALDLEAVAIPGYWKGSGTVPPGESIPAHNHCWAGVKVGGRWRLVDPAAAALHGGGAEERPAAPFFTPPDAWAYMYHPLEAHWQLLPDPIPLSDWWGMPRLGAGFFARGMSLVAPQGLGATYTSPAPKEGAPLPVVELVLGCPLLPGGRLRHVLRDAANGRELCAWPATATATATTPRNAPGGSVSSTQGGRSSQQALTGLMGVGAAAYQQVELPVAGAGPGGPQSLGVSRFGAKSFAPVPHRLGATLPGPGTYDLEVQYVTDVPGGMPVRLEGLGSPLVLRLVVEEEVLRTRVVVPDVEPHEPDEGVLHSDATPPVPLPATHPAFVTGRCALLSPPITVQLEADRAYDFALVVPGASRVAITGPDGMAVAELSPSSGAAAEGGEEQGAQLQGSSRCGPRPPSAQRAGSGSGAGSAGNGGGRRPGSGGSGKGAPGTDAGHLFMGTVRIPRAAYVQVVGYQHMEPLGVCGWVPLLTFSVAPQSQHIVDAHLEPDIPHVDPTNLAAGQAAELWKAMDLDQDGRVRRAEALIAIRRNRQVADILRLPHQIHMHDGSLDKFIEGYLGIDTAKLGRFSFDELCAAMGVRPRSAEEPESGSEYEDDDGQEGEGETASAYTSSRPVSPGDGEEGL